MLNRSDARRMITDIYLQKDKLWALIWLGGIMIAGIWNLLFLNKPALRLIISGFINTFMIAVFVIVFSLLIAWLSTILLYALEQRHRQYAYLALTFLFNLLRSIPQIVGLLLGFILITWLLHRGILVHPFPVLLSVSVAISLFVFQELVDLMRERIRYFQRSDFFNAMRVCGYSDQHIINRDILLKNSRIHIFNKIISLFGISIFLLCSIDFILSVGLSNEVSAVNLPVTLGSLLAKIDSKQDILAIGKTFTDFPYIKAMFFKHLQGITIAFLIVYSLLCIYKIANGFARRYHL